MSALLQTSSGDLDFSSHNLVVVKSQGACVGQKLTNRFRFWAGTWYQDTRQGFPYLGNVLGVVAPNLQAIAQLFKRAISQTPGVASIGGAAIDVMSNTRQMTASFQVVTDDGSVLAGGVGSPFIVVQSGQGQS